MYDWNLKVRFYKKCSLTKYKNTSGRNNEIQKNNFDNIQKFYTTIYIVSI